MCNSNRINLRHNNFLDGTATGNCNGGSIIGRGVHTNVEGDSYTSKLDVNVSTALNGTSVRCSLSSGAGITVVGEATIMIISGNCSISICHAGTFGRVPHNHGFIIRTSFPFSISIF